PGDREHRSRIFALVGDHEPKAIRVRIAQANTTASIQVDLLGRLGRGFSSSEGRVQNAECKTEEAGDDLGTLGTGFQYPRAYADKSVNDDLFIRKLIGSQQPVPSVPEKEVLSRCKAGV